MTENDQGEQSYRRTEQLAAGEVHSPVGGIVVSRHGELGGQVDPTFKDLFQIATDLSMLEISAEAGAPVMARLKPGQNAIIRVAEMPGEGIIGKVARLEQGKVIIEFGNPSPQIKPGLTAQVTIKLT